MIRLRSAAIVSFGVALLFLVPASASAAECPNEQLRAESLVNPVMGQPYSMQLPDCRAYELVSPPNTHGMPALLGEGGAGGGTVFEGNGSQFLATAEGSTVLYESQATPPTTGAFPDGGYVDTFRSTRTSAGWSTGDVLPSAQSGYKALLGASRTGSAVLLETPISFSSEDLDNPLGNVTTGRDLYIVRGGGAQPEFVSHGEVPNRTVGETFTAVNPRANPELTAIGFETDDSLATPLTSNGATPGCYVWADGENRVARLTNPEGTEPGSQRNCRYLAVAANGQPIIEDTSGDGSSGLIFATDPAPSSGFPSEGGTRRLSGSTPRAASFDAMSPSDDTVYLTTTDKLLSAAEADNGADIFGVDLEKRGLTSSSPPSSPALSCISCQAGGTANSGGAQYVGESADGSHVYFTIGRALYQHDPAGTQELAPALDGLEHLVFSADGEYVIAETSVPLSAADTDGATDIYELTAGSSPRLITPGILAAEYRPVAVSTSGQQVVYDVASENAPATIDEWDDGLTALLSPADGSRGYSVLATSGPELENVFFGANEPLVVQDENAGTTDIYDARIDGGFTAPLSHADEASTANPDALPPAAYSGDLAAPQPRFTALPAGIVAAKMTNRVKPITCEAEAKKPKSAKQRKAALRKCKAKGPKGKR